MRVTDNSNCLSTILIDILRVKVFDVNDVWLVWLFDWCVDRSFCFEWDLWCLVWCCFFSFMEEVNRLRISRICDLSSGESVWIIDCLKFSTSSWMSSSSIWRKYSINESDRVPCSCVSNSGRVCLKIESSEGSTGEGWNPGSSEGNV